MVFNTLPYWANSYVMMKMKYCEYSPCIVDPIVRLDQKRNILSVENTVPGVVSSKSNRVRRYHNMTKCPTLGHKRTKRQCRIDSAFNRQTSNKMNILWIFKFGFKLSLTIVAYRRFEQTVKKTCVVESSLRFNHCTMTLSITTLAIMTHSILTFSIIKCDTRHNYTHHERRALLC